MKTTKPLLILLSVAALLVMHGCVKQDQVAEKRWVEYTSVDGAFTVEFPGESVVVTTQKEDGILKIKPDDPLKDSIIIKAMEVLDNWNKHKKILTKINKLNIKTHETAK